MRSILMKRRLLAQTNVAGCLDVLRGTRVASPANYVLADRDGALLDAEITPTALATSRDSPSSAASATPQAACAPRLACGPSPLR